MDNPTEVLKRTQTGKQHYAGALLVLVCIAGLGWLGYRPWKEREKVLFAAAKEEGDRAVPVTAVRVRRAPGSIELTLPGSVSAISETSIYARAEGYVLARHADIGDRVKAGQLLVEIDSPELDEQLRQSRARQAQAKAAIGQVRAALAQSQATLRLAELQVNRTRQLVQQGIVSKQEGDDKQAVFEVRQADVEAQKAALNSSEESARATEAEVARLTSLTVFKRVVAPFAGVITSRTTDVGNLINSSALASGRELFRLADLSTVRVMMNVAEPSAPSIQVGQAAAVVIQVLPGRTFAGKIARTANALDPANRTLLTEVHVANADGKLLPGMYAQVKVLAGKGGPSMLIPGDTLTVRPDGTYVAAVTASSTVHFQKVTVGRDYGAELDIADGLQGDEMLIINPGDAIREGVKVALVAKGK